MEEIPSKKQRNPGLVQAITFALKQGWGNLGQATLKEIDCESADVDGKFYVHFREGVESDMFSYNTFQVLCDSTFWQAIGKTQEKWIERDRNTEKSMKLAGGVMSLQQETWFFHAIRFYGINLQKGFEEADKYLSEIIS